LNVSEQSTRLKNAYRNAGVLSDDEVKGEGEGYMSEVTVTDNVVANSVHGCRLTVTAKAGEPQPPQVPSRLSSKVEQRVPPQLLQGLSSKVGRRVPLPPPD
jgi:hypothetical protein